MSVDAAAGALVAVAGLLWAILAGLVAPGLWVVRRFDLGRDALERATLALAFGRIALGVLALLATTAGAPGLLHAGASVAVVALALQARGRPYRVAGRDRDVWRDVRWPLALGIVASLLLVHATVGRSGLPSGPDGALLFFGRDVTFDPLAHVAAAHHLIGSGLPLEITFVAGTEFTHSYLPIGVRAGVALLSGVSLLDVVFRVLPLLDLLGLCLATLALVRALGGGALAAGLATGLMVLGGGADFLLPLLELVGGRAPAGRDTWAFFGPYLLGANSVTAGLHTWLAALLLLRGAGAARAPAVAAGVLVAACFEIKLFLWAAGLPALVALAVLERGGRSPLRVAALTAVAASVPSLVEKAWWAVRLAETGSQGFGACVGCLPRYLAGAALSGQLPPFDLFERFDSLVLLRRPMLLLDTLLVSAAVLSVALGARLLAVPQLWRGARAPDPGVARVHRLAGLAALAGLAGAVSVRTAPHYLNAAEFTWIATFGLWPFVGLLLADAAARRRWPLVAVGLLLALPAAARVFGPLGYGAPVVARVSAAEQDLLRELRERSAPDALVLEPSILDDREMPSPVTWIAGRPVYLTNRSAAAALPEAEARRRYRHVARVFDGRDLEAARAALGESGARLVYAPAHRPLAPALAAELEVLAEGPAGRVYRVHARGHDRPAGAASGGPPAW